MSHLVTPRSRADGFTLIELLIAMVVGGMMLTVVAAALVLGLDSTKATSDHIEASASTQFASSWFLTDVQSDDGGAGGGCSPGGTVLATFAWGGDSRTTVQWFRSGDQVHRVQCGATSVGAHPVLMRVETASISCPGRQCTLQWTARDDRGNATSFSVTATRRVDGTEP